MDKKECAEFYQELQALLTSRPVSPDELSKYVQFIESSGMDKDAFLMIVHYWVELKDTNIKPAYILKVADVFAQEGNLTAEQVQKTISEKVNRSNNQKEETSSQEEFLIKHFRKLNPRLKKNIIDIVKGLTTSLDNK